MLPCATWTNGFPRKRCAADTFSRFGLRPYRTPSVWHKSIELKRHVSKRAYIKIGKAQDWQVLPRSQPGSHCPRPDWDRKSNHDHPVGCPFAQRAARHCGSEWSLLLLGPLQSQQSVSLQKVVCQRRKSILALNPSFAFMHLSLSNPLSALLTNRLTAKIRWRAAHGVAMRATATSSPTRSATTDPGCA